MTEREGEKLTEKKVSRKKASVRKEVYNNRLLRALAYIAFVVLYVLKVGKYSNLMTIIYCLLWKLADFIKKGRKRKSVLTKIPQIVRTIIFNVGLHAARILILWGVALINGTVCIGIVAVILVIWFIDFLLKTSSGGDDTLTSDEMLWMDLMDED